MPKGYVPPSFLETEKESSSQDWLYEDSSSGSKAKSGGKTNNQKRVLDNAFKGKYGRYPTDDERKKMYSMDGATQTIIGQMKPTPSSWTEKDGYYIPPSETTQGLITPEEHQILGDLYKQLESPNFRPDYGDSKLMNILETIGVAKDKITRANIKNKIERIENPGKFVPDSEDQGYTDSTPSAYWDNTTVEAFTPQAGSVPGQTMDMSTVTNDLGMQVSSDPIIKAQQDLLQYSSKLNRPYMEWGNEAMEELKGLLKENAFDANGKPIENFKFKDLSDEFHLQDYGQQRPEYEQFRAGEAPEMYRPGQAYQAQTYDDFAPRDAYTRRNYEGNKQFRDVAGRPEQPEYEQFQPQTQFFAGNEPQKPFINKYYDEPVKPQMRDIDPQSSLEAPEGEYYNPYSGGRPQNVYQAEEFKIENDPGYNLAMSEAMRGVEASGAARGQLLSGATLKALQDRATGLASQQTAAAYDRYRDKRDFEAQQEREGYGRGERYEDRQTDASRYRNEDKYRRYSDAWQREQAEKEMGRALNDDEFKRWLQEDSQEYGKWQDKRNFAYGEYRDDVGDYRDKRNFRYGQSRDERDDRWQEYTYDDTKKDLRYDRDMQNYRDDRNFAYGKYRDDQGDSWREYTYGSEFDRATNQDRYNRERDAYLTNQDNFRWGENQNRETNRENYERGRNYWQDQTGAYQYGTNLEYNANRDYQNANQNAYNQDYSNFMNLQGDRWRQSLGNLGLLDQHQMRQYGQLQDIYNMNQGNNAQRYKTLMDIINMGRQANQSALGQQGNYTNFMQDWNINQQNLSNAKKQQKSDNWWNALNLFSNSLY